MSTKDYNHLCAILENCPDALCDAALSATTSWQHIDGTAITINREKMRLRLHAFIVAYNNGEYQTKLPEKNKTIVANLSNLELADKMEKHVKDRDNARLKNGAWEMMLEAENRLRLQHE